nr:40S ribosomal protein S21-2-like [Cryptomonas sp.]
MLSTEPQSENIYLPRKCSKTSKLLTSKDYSSIQIKIGSVNRQGFFDGHIHTYTLCGFLRKTGKSDESLNCLVKSSLKNKPDDVTE